MTFEECCKAVLAAHGRGEGGRLMDYAASYANAGLRMSDPDEVEAQALYLKNNLSTWRGIEAREVKAALKALSQ